MISECTDFQEEVVGDYSSVEFLNKTRIKVVHNNASQGYNLKKYVFSKFDVNFRPLLKAKKRFGKKICFSQKLVFLSITCIYKTMFSRIPLIYKGKSGPLLPLE